MKVHILVFNYDITFCDADEGDSYAGMGQRIISVYQDREIADAIAREFGPVFSEAEKETIVWPPQKFNSLLKARFGFGTHDIDSGSDYELSVKTFDVEDMKGTT